MIVKIDRLSLKVEGRLQMLIQNEDRSYLCKSDLTDEVNEIMEEMNKAYFSAEIVEGILQIGDFVSTEEDW